MKATNTMGLGAPQRQARRAASTMLSQIVLTPTTAELLGETLQPHLHRFEVRMRMMMRTVSCLDIMLKMRKKRVLRVSDQVSLACSLSLRMTSFLMILLGTPTVMLTGVTQMQRVPLALQLDNCRILARRLQLGSHVDFTQYFPKIDRQVDILHAHSTNQEQHHRACEPP
jgi:hypothetical protein